MSWQSNLEREMNRRRFAGEIQQTGSPMLVVPHQLRVSRWMAAFPDHWIVLLGGSIPTILVPRIVCVREPATEQESAWLDAARHRLKPGGEVHFLGL